MSAYALPGSFFLPSPSSSPSTTTKTTSISCGVAPGGSIVSEDCSCKSGPVSSLRTNDSFSSGSLSPRDVARFPGHERRSGGRTISGGGTGNGVSDLIVAVKSASVDPVRLVQGLASRGGGGAAAAANDGGGGPTRGSSRRRRSSKGECAVKAAAAENDAIQFHLSISFNGRSYSATRTLPRFVQLRNDLLREISPPFTRNEEEYDTESSSDEEEEEDESAAIPELPVGGDNDAGGSLSSFTRLQALLNQYCPAMERWLRTVANAVPPESSPGLNDFLWEPLGSGGGGSSDEGGDGRRHLWSPAQSSLSADSSSSSLSSSLSSLSEHETRSQRTPTSPLAFQPSSSWNKTNDAFLRRSSSFSLRSSTRTLTMMDSIHEEADDRGLWGDNAEA